MGWFGDLGALVLDVIAWLGYPGLLLLLALEDVFPPVPSEVVLPLAGFLIVEGRLAFWPALLASTTGSVAGALVLYALAWRVGAARVWAFVRRHGHWLLMDEGDLQRADRWLQRHAYMVAVARVVPGLRSLISIPAGLGRMPPLRFAAYTALGAAAWNAFLLALGVLLGERWHLVAAYGEPLGAGVLGVLVAVLLWRGLRKRRTRAGGTSRR